MSDTNEPPSHLAAGEDYDRAWYRAKAVQIAQLHASRAQALAVYDMAHRALCPECSCDNPARARFCRTCGAPQVNPQAFSAVPEWTDEDMPADPIEAARYNQRLSLALLEQEEIKFPRRPLPDVIHGRSGGDVIDPAIVDDHLYHEAQARLEEKRRKFEDALRRIRDQTSDPSKTGKGGSV